MKFLRTSLLQLVAVAVFTAGAAFADSLVRTDPEVAGFSRDRLGRISSYLKNEVATTRFPARSC